MYVRTYVCMYACVHVCVGMYVWACMCARMCARMCALSNVDPIMPYKSKWLIHLARFKVTITFTGLIEGEIYRNATMAKAGWQLDSH